MSENDTDLRIIRAHCGDIAGRIRACRSKMIALQLKDQLCGELARNCLSPVVQNMLQNHVDQLIDVTFDETGMNRYLEE